MQFIHQMQPPVKRGFVQSFMPPFVISIASLQLLLVYCSFSKACWHRLGIHIGEEVLGDFNSWISYNLSHAQADNLTQIPMLCWAIWKSRNDLIWNQRGLDVSEVVSLARIMFEQWKNAQDKTFDLSLSHTLSSGGSARWLPLILCSWKLMWMWLSSSILITFLSLLLFVIILGHLYKASHNALEAQTNQILQKPLV